MDYQDFNEFSELALIVRELKPKKILEIGSMYGDTLFWWLIFSEKVMNIDLPLPPHDPRYSRQQEAYSKWGKWSTLLNKELMTIKDNSHEYKTFTYAKGFLGEVDFLFIDGDHSYEGVKKDFELYSPLVRKGGVIAFHDIIPNPNYGDIQVPQFWNEIKTKYPSREIIKNKDQFGIGVIVYE
jgi:cephalosporin hydroxylase